MVVNHLLRPKVAVSDFVSRSVDPSGNAEYRLKIQNRRRWRRAIDVSIEAYAYLPQLRRPNSNETIGLDVVGDELVGLRRLGRKILYLQVDQEGIDAIRSHLPAGATPNVEALLRLADTRLDDDHRIPRAEIRVWLAYTDSYSGVRSAKHLTYTSDQITSHLFETNSVRPGKPSGAKPTAVESSA